MELAWPVALLVLAAAVLHASWNALTKASPDPLATLATVTLSGGIVAAPATLFVDFPAAEARPFLAASVALHFAYALFLVLAYTHGDLSEVYPIARGLAPCVAAVLAAAVAGEVPTARQAAGLALVSGAIASLALGRGGSRRGVAAALVTALFVGTYTVVDGLGVRRAGAPERWIAWTFVLDALPMTVAVAVVRRRRALAAMRVAAKRGVVGGVLMVAAYAIVLWAIERSAVTPVAALRETSVVFAAWIGARLLGEPFGARRTLTALVVVAGIVLLQA